MRKPGVDPAAAHAAMRIGKNFTGVFEPVGEAGDAVAIVVIGVGMGRDRCPNGGNQDGNACALGWSHCLPDWH